VACLSLSVVAATAPLYNHNLPNNVPDQYLVVFHKNSSVEIRDLHVAELVAKRFRHGSEKIVHKFDIGTLIGYAAVLTKETLAEELEHANVRYIEADQVVTLSDTEFADATETQTGATWGIARIDETVREATLTYSYFASGGAQVTAYVIDTGVLLTHTEFAGRAKWGTDTTGEGDYDGNGHGTHVAGTIGGTIYGVAKKVTIVAVKVLNSGGSGTWAGVIAGVDWVTKDHVARGAGARSVGNMSLGGGSTPTLDEAVEQSFLQGVNHVVAAGNYADNACYYSPARAPTAITVGATTSTDLRASFSNVGPCVDIFAPGNLITSSWIGSNTAISTISGTSMASPHVAGVVAVRLGHTIVATPPSNPSPTEIDAWIKIVGTRDVIPDAGAGSPNLLVFSPFTEVGDI